MCHFAPTEHENMNAIFGYVFVRFLTFLSLSLLKMKKKWRPLSIRYWHETTFLFCAFFSFSVRKSSKMAKIGQTWSICHFFTLGGWNMQLMNISQKIKQFCDVLYGHLDQLRHPGLGRRPTVAGQRPTTYNRAEFLRRWALGTTWF